MLTHHMYTVLTHPRYTTLSSGTCADKLVQDSKECFNSAPDVLGKPISSAEIDSTAFPAGCYAVATQAGYELFFNTNSTSGVLCGQGTPMHP